MYINGALVLKLCVRTSRTDVPLKFHSVYMVSTSGVFSDGNRQNRLARMQASSVEEAPKKSFSEGGFLPSSGPEGTISTGAITEPRSE